jgi:cytochrome b pre-mRNA-processing protein 3
MLFKKLFGGSSQHSEASQALYLAAVAKARDPRLYLDHGVADTVDGRFDLVVLHVMLVMRRLRSAGDTGMQVSQELFDYMFLDMDRSLREMGVGDLSVGKHIRKMAKAFYSRAAQIEAGLDAAQGRDMSALITALRETIYRHVENAAENTPGAVGLAAYVVRLDRHLQRQDATALARGRIDMDVTAVEAESATP